MDELSAASLDEEARLSDLDLAHARELEMLKENSIKEQELWSKKLEEVKSDCEEHLVSSKR